MRTRCHILKSHVNRLVPVSLLVAANTCMILSSQAVFPKIKQITSPNGQITITCKETPGYSTKYVLEIAGIPEVKNLDFYLISSDNDNAEILWSPDSKYFVINQKYGNSSEPVLIKANDKLPHIIIREPKELMDEIENKMTGIVTDGLETRVVEWKLNNTLIVEVTVKSYKKIVYSKRFEYVINAMLLEK